MARQDKVKFTTVLERFEGKGGMHFIDVPDRVVKKFTKTKAVRVMANLNSVFDFHCAIRPKGGGEFYINIGTPIRNKLKLRLGDKLSVAVWPDESEYGREMPRELKEFLAQDEDANKLFHELKPSLQRGIIYYIDGAKSIDKRIERAQMMVNRMKYDPQAFEHKPKPKE